MKYYYYKIENSINQNKYIGITTNLIQRKNRHFNKLRKNEHFNPHLQNAFNKYGKDNFIFSIIEEKDFINPQEAYDYEAVLIKKFDSINNGYNCNPGGTWTGPRGRFTEQEIYYILSTIYFNEHSSGVLAKYFNVAQATINNIRIGRNYTVYCNNFKTFSQEKISLIYDEFCEISNFELLKHSINAKTKSRLFTKEQAFFILRWYEKKYTSARNLCDFLNIPLSGYSFEKPSTKFRGVKSDLSYFDYRAEYNLLTEQEKEKYERLYAEKHIE